MRFVTVLIIIMLVATVYIANMAPGKKGDSSPNAATPVDTAGGRGDLSGDVDTASGLGLSDGDLPTSFPAELTQRSRGIDAPSVPSDSAVGDSSRNPFLIDVDEAARRRKENVREPKAVAAGAGVVKAGPEGQPSIGANPRSDSKVDAASNGKRSTGGLVPVPIPIGVVSGAQGSASPVDMTSPAATDIRLAGSRPEPGRTGLGDAGSPRMSDPERTSVPNTRRGPTLRAPADEPKASAIAEGPTGVEEEVIVVPKDIATDLTAAAATGANLVNPVAGAGKPETARGDADPGPPATLASTPGAVTAPGIGAAASANSDSGSIAGKVSDSGGKATVKVTIEAYDATTGALLESAKSGKDGRFSMAGLPLSKVLLRVVADSVPLGLAAPVGLDVCRTGDEPLGYGAVCVVPKAGAAASASIVLPYSSGVQGTVVGVGGKAMRGAIVRAVSTVKGFEGVKALATTDRDGFFFLTLVPGPYELQIAPPSTAKRERPRRMPIEAEAGSAIVMDTIDLTKASTDQALHGPAPVAVPAPSAVKPAAPQVAEASAKRIIPKLGSPKQSASKPSTTKKPATDPARQAVTGNASPANATPVSLPVAGGTRSGKDTAVLGSTGIVMPGTRVATRAVTEDAEGEVTLTGRVISTWGEAVDGIHLVVSDQAGKVQSEGYTNAEGRYKLTGVPVGESTVAMAPNAPLGKRSSRGIIVRVRPKPIIVRSFPGQERVVVEDQVVDVAPIFRVDGKIEVSKESFDTFKRDLVSKDAALGQLKDERILRIYMRGLELVQKNTGGKGRARHIEITPNGSFSWECSLPAEDVLFVLSPRSSIPSPAYKGPVGVEVTPAGVRTAKLTIQYPPRPKAQVPKDKKKPAGKKSKSKAGA